MASPKRIYRIVGLEALQKHQWTGNIRELNVVKAGHTVGKTITLTDVENFVLPLLR